MADQDYRRLTCRDCNGAFTQLAGRGRPAKDCPPCREAKRTPRRNPRVIKLDPKQPPGKCIRCDAQLNRRGKKYCSAFCREGSEMSRAQYIEQHKAKGWASGRRFACLHCGIECAKRPGSSSRANGQTGKFCSMLCRVKRAELIRSEIAFLQGLGSRVRDRNRAGLRVARALKRISAEKARQERVDGNGLKPCGVCGAPCGYDGMGRPRSFCSRACQRSSDGYRSAQRIAKARRRARLRGVRAEAINPIAVFERDRWICHLCGVKTKRRLRGTVDPLAPELEHIVPIALGGSHTLGNVACSCRACNSAKGARVIGQLGLDLM